MSDASAAPALPPAQLTTWRPADRYGFVRQNGARLRVEDGQDIKRGQRIAPATGKH